MASLFLQPTPDRILYVRLGRLVSVRLVDKLFTVGYLHG